MLKNNIFERNKDYARVYIAEHFSLYKWSYIIGFILIILSIILGFWLGFKQSADCSIDNIPDKIFLSFIKGEISAIGLFFARLFAYLSMILLIWLSCLKRFLSFFAILIVLYKSFMLGISCAILLTLHNVGGLINVIFIMLPFQLILSFFLLIWIICCMRFVIYNSKYGVTIFSPEFWCENKYIVIISIVGGCASIMVEVLLMPWFTSIIFLDVN